MDGDKILRALVGKRLELLGELEHHETAAATLRVDLTHLDGSIRVFTHRLARTLLGVLRTAEKPLSTDELAARAEVATKRAGWVLRYMAECRLVKVERSPGKPALWHATY
jgi:hypothetical protein